MNIIDHINFAYDLAKDKYKGRELTLLLFGSGLPDIYIAGIMDRSKTHTRGEEFLKFCEEKYPQKIPLSKGIILHQKADALFHRDYLREKMETLMRRIARVDRPFFEKYGHGITELGGMMIEKKDLSMKIRKAMECKIKDISCYLEFLKERIKNRTKVYIMFILGKLFYRSKLVSMSKEELDNLTINLTSLTLNGLVNKRVFRNGLTFPALAAGSFYYFFRREKKVENIERMKRLILQAKEELERDYLSYWKWVNDKLRIYI